MRASARALLAALGMLATSCALSGAQLPLRRYSTADGLASNSIARIASDSRGFLWFATAEGLSRFDGYGFANQNESTGLPHSSIRDLLIARRGDFWLATSVGLVRFRPDLPRSNPDRILVLRRDGPAGSSRVTVLLEDHSGAIWCGTEAGLFVVDDPASRTPRLVELPEARWSDSTVRGLVEDPEGGVWIGMSDGTLYRRLPDRRIERYTFPEDACCNEITSLLADRNGRIWVGMVNALYRSGPAPHLGANGFERLSKEGGTTPAYVYDLFESREGDVWAGMYKILAQFPAGGGPVREWTRSNGMPSRGAQSLGQDRDGNLWMGTNDLGAFKLAAGGGLTYSREDGIGMDTVILIAETRRGELYAGGRTEAGHFRIGLLSEAGFHSVEPRVRPGINYYGWRPGSVILQDRTGEWWLATSQGLCRYPRLENPLQLAQTAPKAVYGARDGLAADQVIRLFEDREGNIWIGSESPKITYWSRRREKFIEIAGGVSDRPSAFREDKSGNVWIGDESGQLWRVCDGRASRMRSPARKGSIRNILLDHAGRLWVAAGGEGLLLFEQPAAPDPQFRQYGYAEGLSSVGVRSLAEDSNGFIYIGTGAGVDRLDPDLKHIRHYTSEDGIAKGEVYVVFCDPAGAIWFGTAHGLTRQVPSRGQPSEPPPVWITGLSIAGRPAAISESGDSTIRGIEVQAGQEHIQFDFAGLSYSPGNILRYQYRLGDEPWSAPVQSRSVHYGKLPAGQYRFAVRAVNSDGDVSPIPATVEFQVEPALWRRAWFQAILTVIVVSAVVWVHRARVGRLLEMERVRTRIATDLHDDIGSSLSQIAILSEVASQRAAGGKAGEPAERIGMLSRELLDSISDIVWAIHPHKDHLSDLKQRMRRFAADLLTARDVDIRWSMGGPGPDFELKTELRREVYLIFKESIHNISRHSGATEVQIDLEIIGRRLALQVSDNGCGIGGEGHPEGNGLKSMKLRAARIGGELEIRSNTGHGTTISLRAPLPI